MRGTPTHASPSTRQTSHAVARSPARRRRTCIGAAPIPPPSLGWPTLDPEFLANYKLGPEIAHGSYGTVHDGVNLATGDRVAIKVMQKRGSSSAGAPARRAPIDTLANLQRLQREIDLMAKVSGCRNVGSVQAAFESDDQAIVVLRFVDGGDLEGWFNARGDTPLPERAAAILAFELLKVLSACHAAGVVHGDVKPANIMLSASGAAAALDRGQWTEPFLALSDFGLARACGVGGTVRGCRGTPVFMSPECFAGEYGPPADVYAVGVTLYYLLARRYVYWPTLREVVKLSPRQVRARVLNEDSVFDGSAPPLSQASVEVRDLLASLLSRDADARPTAAAALTHPWFAATLPRDAAPPLDAPPGLESVLAHRAMAPCAVCTLSECPLAGHGPPTPLTRVVDDASAGEVGDT